jgi:hypothetical protein
MAAHPAVRSGSVTHYYATTSGKVNKAGHTAGPDCNPHFGGNGDAGCAGAGGRDQQRRDGHDAEESDARRDRCAAPGDGASGSGLTAGGQYGDHTYDASGAPGPLTLTWDGIVYEWHGPPQCNYTHSNAMGTWTITVEDNGWPSTGQTYTWTYTPTGGTPVQMDSGDIPKKKK